MRIASFSLVFLVLPLLASTYAQAASKESKERIARKACLSGNVEKGVEILSDLFINTGDVTHIYNQARCFEQNHRWDDAASRFLEYLRKAPNLSDADRAEVQKHIADCRSYLDKMQTPQAPATEPQKAVVPAPASNPPPVVPAYAPPPPPPTIQQAQASPASRPGSGLRTAGVVTAAVGGAALITGVIFNLKVNSLASDLGKNDGYDAGKVSDRDTYQTLGWIGYGAGAACVATGAVLYYLGSRSRAAGSPSVALVPAFAPGQAGAFLKGGF